MSEEKSSYRQIMKATSLFGGVQVFNILITLIRSKIIAVLLGPAGMGIIGLLTTTLGLITSLTNFGLARSAVRDVSAANATDDVDKIITTVSILRKLIVITGVSGMIITIILSPLLSQLTFGNYDYTFPFVILSTTILIGQFSAGQSILLQGLRKLSWLAKANIIASSIGLIASLPLYYVYGVNGIVPAIVITALAKYLIQRQYAKRIDIKHKAIPLRQAFVQGKDMIKLGLVLGLSGIIATASSYLIRIFISNVGTIDDVGLYSAGFAIINTYVGMVFTAMITDYYPRLAAIHQDRIKSNQLINQQIDISIYLIAPLICFFLIFAHWIIILIYSSKFSPIIEMIQWGILAIFFKTLGWAIGVLLAAKGKSKHYLGNELFAQFYLLIFNFIGYYTLGLKGLGISYLIGYLFYYIQIYFFTKIKYGFELNIKVFGNFIFFLSSGILCFLITNYLPRLQSFILGGCITVIIVMISLYSLNKKTEILKVLKKRFKN